MQIESRIPSRLAEPPPARLELADADRVVGWIEGDRIAFHGFADANETVNAAWVAYLALVRRQLESGEAQLRAFQAGPPELGARSKRDERAVRPTGPRVLQ